MSPSRHARRRILCALGGFVLGCAVSPAAVPAAVAATPPPYRIPQLFLVRTNTTPVRLGSFSYNSDTDYYLWSNYPGTATDFTPTLAREDTFQLFGSADGQPRLGFVQTSGTGTGTSTYASTTTTTPNNTEGAGKLSS
jgi:hypothetical protein